MPAPSPIVPDTSRRDWTAERLWLLPDDGNRYEVVDGELLVTPSPTWRHQDAIGELYVLLRPYVDRLGLYALTAPADVAFSANTVVQPDLFVVPRRGDGSLPASFDEAGRLILAVEVLSPSSMRADRHVKRSAYLARGVGEYWVVDLDARRFERWTAGSEAAELLDGSLAWGPIDGAEPLVIDLAAYFRRVHGEPEAGA